MWCGYTENPQCIFTILRVGITNLKIYFVESLITGLADSLTQDPILMFVLPFLLEPLCSFYRHATGIASQPLSSALCVSLLSRTLHSLGKQESCSLKGLGIAVQPGLETHRIKCRRNFCSTLHHEEETLF